MVWKQAGFHRRTCSGMAIRISNKLLYGPNTMYSPARRVSFPMFCSLSLLSSSYSLVLSVALEMAPHGPHISSGWIEPGGSRSLPKMARDTNIPKKRADDQNNLRLLKTVAVVALGEFLLVCINTISIFCHCLFRIDLYNYLDKGMTQH